MKYPWKLNRRTPPPFLASCNTQSKSRSQSHVPMSKADFQDGLILKEWYIYLIDGVWVEDIMTSSHLILLSRLFKRTVHECRDSSNLRPPKYASKWGMYLYSLEVTQLWQCASAQVPTHPSTLCGGKQADKHSQIGRLCSHLAATSDYHAQLYNSSDQSTFWTVFLSDYWKQAYFQND